MADKPVLLISACLYGQKVRYDGNAQALGPSRRKALEARYTLQSICPECEAGLGVPRAAAEIVGGDGAGVWSGEARVFDATGADVSAAFKAGAEIAWQQAVSGRACAALLKSGSPSCGNTQIYDGSFSGSRRPGRGVTAEWLSRNGLPVWDEAQVDGPCAEVVEQ